MRAQFGACGQGAREEITSLLNSFQASTIRDEQGESQVARLEARLRYAESAAVDVRGRHAELHLTTTQVHTAEANAARNASQQSQPNPALVNQAANEALFSKEKECRQLLARCYLR